MPPTGELMEDGQCKPILLGRLRTVRLLVSGSLSLCLCNLTVTFPALAFHISFQNLPFILEVPLSAWHGVRHDELPQSDEYGDARYEQTEDLRGTVLEQVSLKPRWVVQVISF